MKIKKRIVTRYCFVSLNTFQRVMIYMLLEFTFLSTKQLMQICLRKGPQGKHFKLINLGLNSILNNLFIVLARAASGIRAMRPTKKKRRDQKHTQTYDHTYKHKYTTKQYLFKQSKKDFMCRVYRNVVIETKLYLVGHYPS